MKAHGANGNWIEYNDSFNCKNRLRYTYFKNTYDFFTLKSIDTYFNELSLIRIQQDQSDTMPWAECTIEGQRLLLFAMVRMNGNGWMDEQMNRDERINGWMKGWITEWMDKWINKWTNNYKNESIMKWTKSM